MPKNRDAKKSVTSSCLFYDTYESWIDELSGTVFNLFSTPPERRAMVSNHETPSLLVTRRHYAIHEVGARLRSSVDPTLADHALNFTRVCVYIGQLPFVSTKLDSLIRPPYRLYKPELVPPGQPLHVQLSFSDELARRINEMKTRVGPGAGWFSIRIDLHVEMVRELL